jgi:hypothetical protein
LGSDIRPKKTWVLGLDPGPNPNLKTQRDPDSEFNSIYFGVEIKKNKINNFWVQKIKEKLKKNF